MGPGGRVLIVERLIPDNPSDAVPVLLSDLNMLLLSGGQERTSTEYGTLLAAAGLEPAGSGRWRRADGADAARDGGASAKITAWAQEARMWSVCHC